MRIADFDYDLAEDRIAQRPAERRESARLMVVGHGSAPLHHTIENLPGLLPRGSLVVVNDTRVLPARLLGTKRGSGGRAEILLVRRVGVSGPLETWRALGKASKGLKPGMCVEIGPLEVHVLEHGSEGALRLLLVGLRTTDGTTIENTINVHGRVPLPPYIRRDPDAADTDRYQTMFAREAGAVAAPTAGLHLTSELVRRLEVRGCRMASVTLHVGLGTFQSVTVDDLDQHPMHEEWFDVPTETAKAVDEARECGVPVVAIGTTVVRALESAASRPSGRDEATRPTVGAGPGETKLLIQPGYRFRAVDLLLTNFHLPRSTLLALVCAFGGTSRVLSAYKVAHDTGYRFFSYGDAMLVSPPGHGSSSPIAFE